MLLRLSPPIYGGTGMAARAWEVYLSLQVLMALTLGTP